MEYKFKALVIDDIPQIAESFKIYKQYLKVRRNIEIDFKVISNEEEYDDNETFDILLVDYNLKHGFFTSDKALGNEFIEQFREKNKISKVIFYSSEFEYNKETKRYKLPLAVKEIFDLINILKVDKIVAKDNFDMMLDVIEQCCNELDVIPLILSRTIVEYERQDIDISYTNLNGQDVKISSLLSDIIEDNEQGKAFKEQLVQTVMTVLLNYKY